MKLVSLLASASLFAAGCASGPVQQKAGVLDYLYPNGAPETPPSDVKLTLPLRVGVAFAPSTDSGRVVSASYWTGQIYEPLLDESEKQRLLQRVVDSFQGVEGVQSIQIVPASYLKPAGGFENADQLRSLLGIDLFAILSFEQTQFQDFNKSSLTYWTVVGAYFVEGNENETHTFVDTSVFDIPSRTLLFNAGGRSKIEKSSTVLESSEKLRSDSSKGFELAIEDMIGHLKGALGAFREQAKSGTVRGAGTQKVEVAASGGAGACGGLELAFALALAGAGLLRRRTSAR